MSEDINEKVKFVAGVPYHPLPGDKVVESGRESESIRGRLVDCLVEDLKPHPTYERNQINVPASQLSALIDLGDSAFLEPLLITREKIILDGYARWKLARRQSRSTLQCIEYDLNEEEALLWLLKRHRRSNGLSAYARVIIALELEPWLQNKAKKNQRLGGHAGGLSKLTEGQKVDVRSEIATVAGVSTGNVFKVKQLVRLAHPEIRRALLARELSIHRAHGWLSKPEDQLNKFSVYQNTRELLKKVHALLANHQLSRSGSEQLLDVSRIGCAITAIASEQNEPTVVREIEVKGNVLLLSTQLLRRLERQAVLGL
jgi:hypothetical protein